MTTLRIVGGRKLSGRVAVEGNKNSALPLLTAYALASRKPRRRRRLMDRLGEVVGLLEEHYRTKSPREKGEARQEAADAARNDAAS